MAKLYIPVRTFFLLASFSLVALPIWAAVPTATSVTVLGEGLYNSAPNPDQETILTGDYVYDDTDADDEGATTYQWYRSSASDGTGLVAIGGATAIRYTITSADIGQYLYFMVTPVDANGDTGTAVTSGASAQVAATSFTDVTWGNTTISADQDHLNAGVSGNNRVITITGSGTLVTVHGDLDMGSNNGTTINVLNGAQLVINGAVEIRNNLIINVDPTSSFIIGSGLIAKNGADLDISGTVNVLGDVDVEQNATFTVDAGGSLDVAGDFNSGDNGVLTFEGDVSVDGNMAVGGDTQIVVDDNGDGTGTLNVGGDLTAGGGSTITGSGPVRVGGDVRGPAGFATDSQLPIELLSFRVTPQDNTVRVEWATQSEENNDFFTIERSADGRTYEAVATVAGAGTSSTVRYYDWVDEKPLAGRSYYRLRQTDYDGMNEVFEASVVQAMVDATWATYPNPAVGTFTLQWPQDLDAEVKIYSLRGELVYQASHGAQDPGTLMITVDQWQQGVYSVHMLAPGIHQTQTQVIH